MSQLIQWRSASIAAAVAQVVESLAAGQVGKRRADREKRILVASYAEDFDYLWACQNDLTEWLALGDRHIVVVWDGAPAPGRLGQYNVAEYLTPADWSVMMTLAVKKVPRITIIDFASHRHQGARTLQMFRYLCRMSLSPLPHIHEVNLAGLTQFLSALPSQASPQQPTADDRSMLRALWNSLLGEGKATHHAITNIVSPLLLLESMDRSMPMDGSVIPAALRRLIRVLQEPDQPSTGQTRTEPGGKEPWFDFKSNLGQWADSVILIDDLAENGWGDVLRAMLGLEVGGPMVGVYIRPLAGGSGDEGAALDLPGYLRRRLDWLRSDRRSAPPSLAPNAENPLVFLDIRLFSQSSLGEERRFYRDLLVLAREFAALPAPGWPLDFSDNTLEAVERFTDGKADLESPDHHAALSLLPRLLALADPTLPIVLFSSTGRRAIIEPLIPCGNVIFDFEKPRLTGGDWNEAVDRARAGFKHAMERVTPLLRARSFLRELREDASRAGNLLHDAAARFECVEVYVDESGDDRSSVFSVGGVIVLYPDAKIRDQLNQALMEKELVWGLAESHPPVDANDAIPERYLPKYPGGKKWNPGAYNEFLNRLDECLVDLNVRLAAFAIVWRPRVAQTSVALPEPLREDVIDNRYRRMIEEALEAVLYCLLPAYGATDAQVSVDCGTRQRSPLPPYDAERLKADFGIGSNPRSGDYYVMSAESVYSIVGRLLASRSGPPPNVRRARGTTLYDYEYIKDLARKSADAYRRVVNDQSRPRPRQIHYLADWFARIGMHYPNCPGAKIVTAAFNSGFLENRDERFAGWLRASRAGANGRVTDALSECWMATRQKEPAWSVARWLRGRAAEWTEMLDGPGFVELATRIHAKCAKMSEPGHKQKTGVPVRELLPPRKG